MTAIRSFTDVASPWTSFDEPPPPARLPLPWLLFALVVAAWWPLDTYWQSDDFIALAYASDASRAVSDFAGNQYGLPGLVWFYRPLITLSFAVDQLLGGGPEPFVSHLSNVLAHGVSAVLLGAIVTRFVGGASGFACGLLWALAPSHAGSIVWAVGRVDSHTTVWILASVLFALGRRRVAATIAFALALCSKELALATPGIAAVLCFAHADARGFGARLRSSLASTWPLFVVVPAYFALRFALFDRLLGGYEDRTFAPLSAITGLGEYALRFLAPWRYVDAAERLDRFAPLVIWASAALPLVALVTARRRVATVATTLVVFVGAAVPIYQFWDQSQGVMNLRYLYLPSMALCALVVAGGWLPAFVLLASWALPFVEVRERWIDAGRECRRTHELLGKASADNDDVSLLFVGGLPRTSSGGAVIGFHYGIDRLLQPPFGPEPGRDTLAFRPFAGTPDAHALSEAPPFRDTLTLSLEREGVLAALPPLRVPKLTATPTEIELSTVTIHDLHEGSATATLDVSPNAAAYRVTLFTPTGYLTTLVPNRARTGAAATPSDSGRIDWKDVLLGRIATTGARSHVAWALQIATAVDLETRYPVLIEAGSAVADPRMFVPTHANREPVWVSFDREFPDFMAGRPPSQRAENR